MKLAACKRLALEPIRGTWYRAIARKHWKTALQTAQTSKVITRFNAGKAAVTPFEILYLAENSIVALYEVGAVFGPPEQAIANPHQSKVVPIDVHVLLRSIADLTDPNSQRSLDVSTQELTGNWEIYSPGEAPTQRLGAALFATENLEGFLTVSAKIPRCRNLIVFPEKLLKGSRIEFQDDITKKTHVIEP